jgi:GAF domain-containing protein
MEQSIVSSDRYVELADLFADLGRTLTAHRTVDQVLQAITHRTIELVPAAEHAAISRGRNGKFETVFPTSDVPLGVDQLQYDQGSGPCVDAVLDDVNYRVLDLTNNAKWPRFGKAAAEQYGIRSMLSVRLFLEETDLLVGLNLYAGSPAAFDESDETVTMLLATHAALALTAARRLDKIDNLERALQTSRRIGVAVGILRATHTVTDDQAFGLLRIASQSSNRKVLDLAEGVIHTGMLDLPEFPQRRRR